MSYSCIPEWQQPTKVDPFDYKLRSPKEIEEEHRLVPPIFPLEAEHCEYPNGDATPGNLDFRETIVRRL